MALTGREWLQETRDGADKESGFEPVSSLWRRESALGRDRCRQQLKKTPESLVTPQFVGKVVK
ncbi:hypothetical protein ETB97_001802 [Aspergillus alliaceus]|uniref:Uncharacterized protein n=1 Tax=Petromyces alliaceus TaxID=209559 RepID=A0A8H6E6H0_PETAA|nr:hypothetical protein ETB97_001802 [Aspergillus burnettii]